MCAHISCLPCPCSRINLVQLQGAQGRQCLVPEQTPQLEEDLVFNLWVVQRLVAGEQARPSARWTAGAADEGLCCLARPRRVVARAPIKAQGYHHKMPPTSRTHYSKASSDHRADDQGYLGTPPFLASHTAFLAHTQRTALSPGTVREATSITGMGMCESAGGKESLHTVEDCLSHGLGRG